MELDIDMLYSDYNYGLDFPSDIERAYRGPSYIDKILKRLNEKIIFTFCPSDFYEMRKCKTNTN